MILDVFGRFSFLGLVLQPADEGIQYFSLRDPYPEPNLAWFILNAFFLIAVALAATVAIGILFGSFRLWLLDRFPNNRFNGAPVDDPALTFRLSQPAGPDRSLETPTGSSPPPSPRLLGGP